MADIFAERSKHIITYKYLASFICVGCLAGFLPAIPRIVTKNSLTRSTMDFVPTKAYLKSAENIEFQSVTYEAYKPKNKQRNAPQEQHKPRNDNEFNIKQAKHEVIKFGTSGLDPEKKQQAKIELAIKLGAKPPKRKYINYKQLLSERKKRKEAETSRLDFQQLGKTSAGKSTAKGKSFDRKRRKKRPTSSGILGEYGVVKAKR